MEISAIAFDIGNVLFRVYHAKTRAALGEYAGVTEEVVREKIFGSLHDELERGLLTPEGFRLRASQALGKDIPYDYFAHAWNDISEENREIIPLLETLEKTKKLLLISNTDPLHFAHFQQFEVIGRFFAEPSRRILSFEAGVRKPEKEIYAELVAVSGGEASEILYIDDMIEFVDAFKNLGGNAIQYNAKTDLIESLKQKLSLFEISV